MSGAVAVARPLAKPKPGRLPDELPARTGGTGRMPDDPTAFAALLGRALLEVDYGLRSPLQLARWVSAEVFEQAAHRAGVRQSGDGQVTFRVRTVRAQRVAPSEIEAAVVADDGRRVHAIALRALWSRERWIVTAAATG